MQHKKHLAPIISPFLSEKKHEIDVKIKERRNDGDGGRGGKKASRGGGKY